MQPNFIIYVQNTLDKYKLEHKVFFSRINLDLKHNLYILEIWSLTFLT